jgi:hypothetical protein
LHEFVAIDAGGDASSAILIFDANHVAEAVNIHVACQGNFFGKREDEFDFGTWIASGVDREVEPSKTHVTSLAMKLGGSFVSSRTNRNWQSHGIAPSGTPFCTLFHEISPLKKLPSEPVSKLASK